MWLTLFFVWIIVAAPFIFMAYEDYVKPERKYLITLALCWPIALFAIYGIIAKRIIDKINFPVYYQSILKYLNI